MITRSMSRQQHTITKASKLPKQRSITKTRSRRRRRQRVSDLPNNILMCILLRLPLKDLYSCRRVCKSWLTLLSDPYFAELQQSVAPTGVLALTKPLSYIRFIDLCQSHRNVLKFRTPFKFKAYDYETKWQVSNACNGLFCWYEARVCKPFYVCNPIVNEYVPIPPVKSDNQFRIIQLGFGFGISPVTNQYKVIRCLWSHDFHRSPRVEIRSLCSTTEEDSWRIVGSVPSAFLNSGGTQKGPFLHGAVHYLLSDLYATFYRSIICFDFVDESFRFLPSPSQFGRNEPISKMNLTVFRNCLSIGHCVLSTDTEPRLEVWMMTDYGVEESWAKVISIAAANCKNDITYCPVILLNKDEIFLWAGDPVSYLNGEPYWANRRKLQLVVSFDPTTRRFKVIETYKRKGEILSNTILFVPSLVSLKDVVGEHYKNLERGRRVSIREKSLKTRVTEEEAKLEDLIRRDV